MRRGICSAKYGASGDLIQETVCFEDLPVAVLKPNGSGGVNVFYIHTDHLNTPRPFGVKAANQDPDGDSNAFVYKLRFPGQYFDSEAGLHFNYSRDVMTPQLAAVRNATRSVCTAVSIPLRQHRFQRAVATSQTRRQQVSSATARSLRLLGPWLEDERLCGRQLLKMHPTDTVDHRARAAVEASIETRGNRRQSASAAHCH